MLTSSVRFLATICWHCQIL